MCVCVYVGVFMSKKEFIFGAEEICTTYFILLHCFNFTLFHNIYLQSFPPLFCVGVCFLLLLADEDVSPQCSVF